MAEVPLDRVPRGGTVPRNRPRGIDFYRLGQAERPTFMVVSSSMETVPTHWWNKRTVPHVDPREACEPCRLGFQQPTWYGFILAVDPKRKLWILRLSAGAIDSCPALEEEAGKLRGLQLTWWREVNGARGLQRVALRQLTNPPTIPPELPVWPVLLNIWGLHPDFPPCKREPGSRYKRKTREEAN